MTEEEIERLKHLNCALFKRGYAQVRSIKNWEERVRTDSVRKPCPRQMQNSGHV